MIPKGIPVLLIFGWVDWTSPSWPLIPFLLVILPKCSQMQISPLEKGFLQPWSPVPASHGVWEGCFSLFSLLCYLQMVKSPEGVCKTFWLLICAFISRNSIHCFHPILKETYKTKRLNKPCSQNKLFTIPQKFPLSHIWFFAHSLYSSCSILSLPVGILPVFWGPSQMLLPSWSLS